MLLQISDQHKKRPRYIPLNHLNLEQTAMLIGISKRTLQLRMTPSRCNELGKFEIPSKKHNGIWVFRKNDVRSYLKDRLNLEIDIDTAIANSIKSKK